MGCRLAVYQFQDLRLCLASWPEQKVVRCTVGTLAESTRANGITKTALIVVGEFLGTRYERSKLYDPTFTTEFRKGADQ